MSVKAIELGYSNAATTFQRGLPHLFVTPTQRSLRSIAHVRLCLYVAPRASPWSEKSGKAFARIDKHLLKSRPPLQPPMRQMQLYSNDPLPKLALEK